MKGNSSSWNISYLGWSGFDIFRSDQGPHIFIDPPKGTVFPVEAALIIFITHGHPEHLGGTLDLLAKGGGGQDITLIGSKTVCQYLTGHCRADRVSFREIDPGQKYSLDKETGFEVFPWQHMPLLPPGIRPAIRHILAILKNFPLAWRIIRMSLGGPRGPGPMLGYLLHLPGDSRIMVYGEGLHRRCQPGDVVKGTGATLLVASEPEDVAELPELVAAIGAKEAILYEPHRGWREAFSLPHVDMSALQQAIENKDIVSRIAAVKATGY